jgi:hypothetical protein
MQINLKQTEIETALRDYVSKLGFSLDGREVGIVFTSGRKNNGLTADIEISDTLTPTANPIPSGPISREAVIAPAQTEVDVVEEPVYEEVTPATTSLFGG